MNTFHKTETEVRGVAASFTNADGSQFILVAPSYELLAVMVKKFKLTSHPEKNRNVVITPDEGEGE